MKKIFKIVVGIVLTVCVYIQTGCSQTNIFTNSSEQNITTYVDTNTGKEFVVIGDKVAVNLPVSVKTFITEDGNQKELPEGIMEYNENALLVYSTDTSYSLTKNEWGQIEKNYTYTADNQISSCKYQDEELPKDIYYTYSEDTNDLMEYIYVSNEDITATYTLEGNTGFMAQEYTELIYDEYHYEFRDDGLVSQIKKENSENYEQWDFVYDSMDNLIGVIEGNFNEGQYSEKYKYKFAYDEKKLISAIRYRLKNGNFEKEYEKTIEYNENGKISHVEISYYYSENGTTDSSTYEYDDNRLIKLKDSDGFVVNIEWEKNEVSKIYTSSAEMQISYRTFYIDMSEIDNYLSNCYYQYRDEAFQNTLIVCGRQMTPLIDGYVTKMETYSVMGFSLEGIVYDIYKHVRQDNFWRRLDY